MFISKKKPRGGKPNLPPGAEGHYKATRNAAAQATQLEANLIMLQKYPGHTEHIIPMIMKIKANPAFGTEDLAVEGHH